MGDRCCRGGKGRWVGGVARVGRGRRGDREINRYGTGVGIGMREREWEWEGL